MATKKDLVEAYAFSRRRLVTAFVSGAPGGREVEPARPGRTIVGGLALAVLLLAGAAVAGVFAPRDPEDWAQPGLVVSDETGATYLILEESSHPTLRPVINITSARLALKGDIKPRIISQDTIDDQTIGDDIGILGAPATLPTPSLLIQTGWTACTGDGLGLRVQVAERPAVRAIPGAGFLVESEGVHYVVATSGASDGDPSAYSYRLAEQPERHEGDEQDTMLDELGLPIRDQAARVPEQWLDLFPSGGALDWESFGLTGFGEPAPDAGALGVPDGARVGDVLTSDEGSLLLTRDGPAELTDFALAVYRHVPTPRGRLTAGSHRSGDAPLERIVDAPPQVGRTVPSYLAAHWPDTVLRTEPGQQCARLTAGSGRAPTVQLATDPVGLAAATPSRGGELLPPQVAAGRGAYVRSGGWADDRTGAPFVLDAKGLAYPLVGPEAADRLGYGGTSAPVVPDSWVELFEAGVPLSVDAALCPPDPGNDRPCD
jgi:ESX secretion system ATPase EccB